MISYFGLSGKIVTRANQSKGLFKLSWKPVAYIFFFGIGFRKNAWYDNSGKVDGYQLFDIFSERKVVFNHAADSKIANLVRSAFPSTYTQTDAAPYLPLPPPPTTNSRNTLRLNNFVSFRTTLSRYISMQTSPAYYCLSHDLLLL